MPIINAYRSLDFTLINLLVGGELMGILSELVMREEIMREMLRGLKIVLRQVFIKFIFFLTLKKIKLNNFYIFLFCLLL